MVYVHSSGQYGQKMKGRRQDHIYIYAHHRASINGSYSIMMMMRSNRRARVCAFWSTAHSYVSNWLRHTHTQTQAKTHRHTWPIQIPILCIFLYLIALYTYVFECGQIFLRILPWRDWMNSNDISAKALPNTISIYKRLNIYIYVSVTEYLCKVLPRHALCGQNK